MNGQTIEPKPTRDPTITSNAIVDNGRHVLQIFVQANMWIFIFRPTVTPPKVSLSIKKVKWDTSVSSAVYYLASKVFLFHSRCIYCCSWFSFKWGSEEDGLLSGTMGCCLSFVMIWCGLACNGKISQANSSTPTTHILSSCSCGSQHSYASLHELLHDSLHCCGILFHILEPPHHRQQATMHAE